MDDVTAEKCPPRHLRNNHSERRTYKTDDVIPIIPLAYVRVIHWRVQCRRASLDIPAGVDWLPNLRPARLTWAVPTVYKRSHREPDPADDPFPRDHNRSHLYVNGLTAVTINTRPPRRNGID